MPPSNKDHPSEPTDEGGEGKLHFPVLSWHGPQGLPRSLRLSPKMVCEGGRPSLTWDALCCPF